jgi:probable rRNA maturation factor
MIHIQIADGTTYPFDTALLERAVQGALQFTQAAEDAELTVVISTDEQLQQLNREFLGIDAPTDVLAFPADFADPDSQQPYLGDVIISLPRALEQSAANLNGAQSELLLLAVHGTLHLLGYDHATEEDQADMWAAQAEILKRLDL